jgi:ABC-type dipeptide/oligopeptide/nickel transport system ATPase component
MTVPLVPSVLELINVRLGFGPAGGMTEVLHGISLRIRRGEKVALVGESGSGKSVTARLVLGLLQGQRGVHVDGAILFEGREMREPASLRGTSIAMILQDPTSSLNPVFPIATQFHEVLRRRQPRLGRAEADRVAKRHLESVSIDQPDRVLASYPFQLSGGMNQRVMIAMALANHPALLVADEPGSALDVTVQAQTLALMDALISDTGTAVLFISHNLGVVREFADRIYVIYRGRIVEHGTARQVFTNPGHPYTRALFDAAPKLTGGMPSVQETEVDFQAPMVDHVVGMRDYAIRPTGLPA